MIYAGEPQVNGKTMPKRPTTTTATLALLATMSAIAALLLTACAALLAARDTLAGEGEVEEARWMNWMPDIGIGYWDGISIDNNRVSELRLNAPYYGLNGELDTGGAGQRFHSGGLSQSVPQLQQS